MNLTDGKARQEALNTQNSYIVQAPAGSGKTGLLIQRFLVLLAQVEQPEHILAITFTRKAANEMRSRIIQALNLVNKPVPDDDYEKQLYQLAQRVIEQDKNQEWSLLVSPYRLRIQTIDSLCSDIVGQMPIHSQFGAHIDISEKSEKYYYEAVQDYITYALSDDIQDNTDSQKALKILLEYLDNRIEKLSDLLVSMLSKRDQWIRHFVTEEKLFDRTQLEKDIQLIIEKELKTMLDVSSHHNGKAFFSLLKNIVSQYVDIDSSLPIAILAQRDDWPSDGVSELKYWHCLSAFLLTNQEESGIYALKKRMTVKEGIRAPSSEKDKQLKEELAIQKERINEWLAEFVQDEAFIKQLSVIKNLPKPEYSDIQWKIIQAIHHSLYYALGFLKLVFKKNNQVDFIELSLAAQKALYDATGATDLALKLDNRIQHLLMDEFQDTSHNQYELMRLLIQGWQPNDGRTLFLVGDPMQSIYRFREADVGLFQKCWRYGIDDIDLKPLLLTTNFRSHSNIIAWVNKTFTQVFPKQDDLLLGRVSMKQSNALEHKSGGDVILENLQVSVTSTTFQAQRVLEQIDISYQKNPEGTIAVLVRNKSHVQDIIDLLQMQNLPFIAVEMNRLSHKSVILDCRNITRIVLNKEDRLAWLGLLRSPFCGLQLKSIHCVIETIDGLQGTVDFFTALEQNKETFAISDEQKQYLIRFLECINEPLLTSELLNLSERVQLCWYALGGAHTCQSEADKKDVKQFFTMLQKQDWFETVFELDEQLEYLFSEPEILDKDSDSHAKKTEGNTEEQIDGNVGEKRVPIQIMTMHKAKGLEFDTVILPYLEKQGRPDAAALILWQEFVDETEQYPFLVAPMRTQDKQDDRLYDFLKNMNKKKTHYETGRLLYVATTRAKKRLVLLTQTLHDKYSKDNKMKTSKEDLSSFKTKPSKQSLLGHIWNKVDWHTIPYSLHEDKEHLYKAISSVSFQRLPSHFTVKFPEVDIPIPDIIEEQTYEDEVLEFDWASANALLVGSLIHRYLERICLEGVNQWNHHKILQQKDLMMHFFYQKAVNKKSISLLVDLVCEALRLTLDDDQGRWILSEHTLGVCEQSLTQLQNKQLKTYIIDRSFIDENNTRWIIDYKSGRHLGSGLDDFFVSEKQRYLSQLKQYASLYQQNESCSIQCALYYPFHQRLLVYDEEELK